MTGVAAPAVVVVLGIVAIIISALQAMLMLFRQGALVVLAGTLPLAAAGTLTPATRPWFKKVTGWMLALIFYKPAAAAVYAAAFTMIGTGKDVRTILAGFAMVLMSLLALPVLMRFFTWTGRPGHRCVFWRRVHAGRAFRRGRGRCPARLFRRAGRGQRRRPGPPAITAARPGRRRAERRPGSRRRGPAVSRRARTGRQSGCWRRQRGCRAGWRRCGRAGRARGRQGLAAGARSAGRTATEAMQPPGDQAGGQ